MAGEPLPDLTMLASLMEPKKMRAVVAKAQKAAWNEWAGIALASRLSQKAHPNPWGFSQRSSRYMRRRAALSAAQRIRNTARNDNKGMTKGDLPDYVFTGSAKREVTGRKAKTAYRGEIVATRRSIHFRALNAMGDQRGWTVQREVKGSKVVQRTAHSKVSSKGKAFAVRAYKQRSNVVKWSGTVAAKTYRQEWEMTDAEVAQVSRRSDEILSEGLRAIGYDKKGRLKLKFRREIERRAAAEG